LDKALIPIVIFALVFVTQFMFASRCDWQCGNCGHTFSLSPLTAILMPHRLGGQKLVNCPNCGARSWASPVRKE
jgi:DNA-directed RNA polymerase subunit RPC12/RpoP